MNSPTPAIQIENLAYAYGRAEAVHDLSLKVQPGRCYGLFGRNGAGKTTTMKCLLNLLRPQRGQVRVFGLDPARAEVAVKGRLAYVPDQELLERFRLDPAQRTDDLSKGQRTQVALIAAICPETDLLVLDEPTSGLDPIVRREFIETVIGAYQEGNPGNRAIFVSTHLITEFEGLIDEFTIIDRGRVVVTLDSDQARERFQKIRARFAQSPPELDLKAALMVRREGRELELIVNGAGPELLERLRQHNPEALSTESLTMEEIFFASLKS